MNILFMTLGNMNNLKGNGLYIDLINELKEKGNEVYVLSPNERRNDEGTNYKIEDGFNVLRVKTGNITKTNIIEKGIATILIESQFISAIKKYFNNVKFDLIIYTTPPVTFAKVVSYVKKRDNCLSYLILKDIFPQNAVDLDIMKKNSLIYRYFRSKEKQIYAVSDFIGCTSQGNIEYVRDHNPEISPTKLELFPNSINPRNVELQKPKRDSLRKKYNIPRDSTVFVYGGSIGKPQGVEFIKEVLRKTAENEEVFNVILGSGTEFINLFNFIENTNFKNVKIMKSMPQEKYWDFLGCCDVGLIFLDPRFTVPNTPARLTYYMESALPIIAATDKHTDIKDILSEAKCGYWLESGDIYSYLRNVEQLIKDKTLREELGINGRVFLEKHLTIGENYKTLEKHIRNRGDENV